MDGRNSFGLFCSSLLFFSVFVGNAQADTPQSCSSTTWSPYWGSLGVFSRTASEVGVRQPFYWTPSRLANFKALQSNYQFEIRRMSEVWDFWRNNCPSGCTGYYWSNLPGASPYYSEESDAPWCCWLDHNPNEEFQINSNNYNALQSNYWYWGYGWLLRDAEDRGRPFHLHSESEYCGAQMPYCNFGQKFGWCTMSSKDEIA